MLQRVHCQDHADIDIDALAAGASPAVARLVWALSDCCHPKATRLLHRLARQPEGDDLAGLRYDVLELLTLTFGRNEALRRLQ